MRMMSPANVVSSSRFAIVSALACAVAFGTTARPAAAVPTCPLALLGCSTVEPADASHGTVVEIDGMALTFFAVFNTANQNGSTIPTDVASILTASGFGSEVYLGRQDGTGSPAGVVVGVVENTSNGGLSGTWALTQGASTNYVGDFIAIHAGGGQRTVLFQVNAPGISGIWDTSENTTGTNHNQATLSNFDLFGSGTNGGTTGGGTGAPEPAGLVVLAVGLIGLGVARLVRSKR